MRNHSQEINLDSVLIWLASHPYTLNLHMEQIYSSERVLPAVVVAPLSLVQSVSD